MKQIKTITAAVLSVLLFIPCVFAENEKPSENNKKHESKSGYALYLDDHPQKGTGEIILNGSNLILGENAEIVSQEGKDGIIKTTEDGFAEFETDIFAEGLYNIELCYFPTEGKGGAIERRLYINGELPFNEAGFLRFSRLYQNREKEFKKDANGNEIRPVQEELRQWMTVLLSDPFGYEDLPFLFYFKEGKQKIKLESVKEPMLISQIRLFVAEDLPSYEEYKNKNKVQSGGGEAYIEAEKPLYKSDFSIYPYTDRSSPKTSPQSTKTLLLNAIGNEKWQNTGQFITYEFDVDGSGYYKIAPRFRQNIYDGVSVSRKLLLDGKVPFKEALSVKFDYSGGWSHDFVKKADEELEFFLEKGTHTLTFEVNLGDAAPILSQVDRSISVLNDCYRKILMITGPVPDLYRDYVFEESIPDVISELENQAKLLESAELAFSKRTGVKGGQTAILSKIIFQIKTMHQKPDKIAESFASFKSNIAALGTWVYTQRQQPLELDFIRILPSSYGKKDLLKAEGNFWDKLVFETKSFFYSFVVDYYAFSDEAQKKSVKVWLSTGRDQAVIVKGLCDELFTPKTGITVNLELVGEGTLLPSVLSGTGPDVSLSNAVGDPVNYAVRKAVVDLKAFENIEEVKERFAKSAITPFEFNGGTYALPETQSFLTAFYRTDIFEEMNLTPPKTWAEFYTVSSELQRRNMEVGFPVGYQGLQMLLYQSGGNFYQNDYTRSSLDSDKTADAFQKLVRMFTVYRLPYQYDFANRFRSGEMPYAIGDYTLYNQLTVFAPEIKGLWSFAPLPSEVDEDGKMNGTSPSTGTAVMMLRDAKDQKASFEFMDFWTGQEAQSRFCMEMESLMGPAAKQPTANLEALSKLSWSSDEYKILSAQLNNTTGTQEVPGGYYIQRLVDFAFTEALTNSADPSRELQKQVRTVNDEIKRKRKEFGLKD